MREDICSIPISEIFEPKDGCPFCRMRDMLEDRMATYITGAAMMEPDVLSRSYSAAAACPSPLFSKVS